MSQAQPLVSIIVINMDGCRHLENFLESVNRQDFPSESLEVIVVDNASRDGSLAFLRRAHPTVHIIENSENRGFAPAVNQGAAIARGRYLALLNNDLRLAPDWLTRMVQHLEDAPADVVCVASSLLDWDGERIDFIGGQLGFHGFASQVDFRAPVDALDEYAARELLFACGGAMMIDREVYGRVGGFDEDYFAYFEDVDLGWRLWVMGYRVELCPRAVAYHRFHGTSGRFPAHQRTTLYERNALLTIIKNYDDEALASALPASLMLLAKRIAIKTGLEREAFRLGGNRSRRLRSRGSLGKRFLRMAGELGWLTACRRAWPVLLTALLTPLRSAEVKVVSMDALAGVAALEDVIELMPRIYEKRRTIQSARRRADCDIYPHFGAPFGVGMDNAALREAQQMLVSAMGLDERLMPAEGLALEDEGGLVAPPPGEPLLSVIIAVDPAHPYLPGDLEAFLEQTAPPTAFELIVVDWEKCPSQAGVIERFRRLAPEGLVIRYLRQAAQGRATMHNVAIGQAKAPVICFGADDYSPGPGYVETHLRFHRAHPELHRVAFGAGLSPAHQRMASPFLAWLEDTGELNGVKFREAAPDHPPNYFTVANCSIKKEFLLSAGPFDERLPFTVADDEEMGHRLSKLGLASTFLREADMTHDHLIRLPERCRHLVWAGYSKAVLAASDLPAGQSRAHWSGVKRDAYRRWWRFVLRDDIDMRGAWWQWRLTRAYLKGYRHFLRRPGELAGLYAALVVGKCEPSRSGLGSDHDVLVR